MKLFEETGILTKHDFKGGKARYEELRESHHDHLIDVKTGEIIEFVDDEIELLQKRWQKNMVMSLLIISLNYMESKKIINVKKVFVKTFGCQMNVYDSDRIIDALKIIGYEKSENLGSADCFVLNTCHIRDKAKEKVYHEIGRVRETFLNKNKPLVIVTGCVAQGKY